MVPRGSALGRPLCLVLAVWTLLSVHAEVNELDNADQEAATLQKTMTPEELVRHREAPLIKHDTGMQLGRGAHPASILRRAANSPL